MCNSNWCTLHMTSYIDEHSRVLQYLLLTFASPSKNIHPDIAASYIHATLTPSPSPHTYPHNYTYTATHLPTHTMHIQSHMHIYTHTPTHTHTHTHTHTYQFLEETVSVLAVFQWTHFPTVIHHIRTQQYLVIV